MYMTKTFKLLNCHPKKTRKKNTCYDDNTLLLLKKRWNENNKIKIKTNDPTKIWTELKQNIKNCNNELCWLKKTLKGSNKLIVKENFVPTAPVKEWEKYNNWLSSTEFNNVMRQYMEKHSNFLYLGPSPIDFDTKIRGKCVWPTLCNLNIKRQMKKGINKIGIILNLDKHDGDGTHWVTIFIDLENKYIFYFESTGSTIPPEVTVFMERMKKQCADLNIDLKIMDNMKMRHQYGLSECGMYCLYFIVSLLENRHTPEHFLKNRVTDEEMKNIRDIYFNKI